MPNASSDDEGGTNATDRVGSSTNKKTAGELFCTVVFILIVLSVSFRLTSTSDHILFIVVCCFLLLTVVSSYYYQ